MSTLDKPKYSILLYTNSPNTELLFLLVRNKICTNLRESSEFYQAIISTFDKKIDESIIDMIYRTIYINIFKNIHNKSYKIMKKKFINKNWSKFFTLHDSYQTIIFIPITFFTINTILDL